jgi:hypothetical protein
VLWRYARCGRGAGLWRNKRCPPWLMPSLSFEGDYSRRERKKRRKSAGIFRPEVRVEGLACASQPARRASLLARSVRSR